MESNILQKNGIKRLVFNFARNANEIWHSYVDTLCNILGDSLKTCHVDPLQGRLAGFGRVRLVVTGQNAPTFYQNAPIVFVVEKKTGICNNFFY